MVPLKGRNDFCIKLITRDLACLEWEEAFLCIKAEDLNDEIRAKLCAVVVGINLNIFNGTFSSVNVFFNLLDECNILYSITLFLSELFVDVGKNYSVVDAPQFAFIYEYIGTREVQQLTSADQYVS